MIQGVVTTSREAVVRLPLRGPSGTITVDATIDTGYTGTMTLPADLAATVGLVLQPGGDVVLADGSIQTSEAGLAEIEWDGSWRIALATIVGDTPLIGMRLLADHELWMEVAPGGHVEIRPIP